jgi:hypothetical protein
MANKLSCFCARKLVSTKIGGAWQELTYSYEAKRWRVYACASQAAARTRVTRTHVAAGLP